MMTLMVCISTNQEVTNLIPALEYEASAVVTFATPHAVTQRWPQRLSDALRTRHVYTVELTKDLEYAPARLAQLILHRIAQHRHPGQRVCFAWAGGQKPQSVGMWLAFEALSEREPDGGHIAAYMEQNQGKLLQWRRPADVASAIEIMRPLSIDELLACYGQKIREGCGPGIPLWPLSSPESWIGETYELYQHNDTFRALCFEYHLALQKGKNIRLPANKSVSDYLTRVNNKKISQYISPDEFKLSPHVQENKSQEFPFLFEQLVQHRAIAWLERRAAHISEARANVSFASLKPDEPSGELDVAILSRAGRLIALDAKINAKGSGAMRRAQESSVRQSGGDFAKRAIVIPAHSADIKQAPPWLPAENVNLVQRWRQDPRSVSPLVPFDEGQLFEQALDSLCGFKL